MTCIVTAFLPFMYLSKCSMSPLHSSRPFNTRRLKLARVLLASSISVLVSIHIPAAAGPRQYKTWQMDNNYAAILQGSSYLWLFLFRSCLCLFLYWLFPSAPSRSSPLSFASLALPLPFPVRFKGVTYKPGGNVFTQLSSTVPETNKVQQNQRKKTGPSLAPLSSLSPLLSQPHSDISLPIVCSFKLLIHFLLQHVCECLPFLICKAICGPHVIWCFSKRCNI